MIRGSAAVAQLTVNQLVAGSNPAPGANLVRVSRDRYASKISRIDFLVRLFKCNP